MLLGCASCGIREFPMFAQNKLHHQTHVEDLKILKLTDKQITSLSAIHHPYQKYISFYLSNSGKEVTKTLNKSSTDKLKFKR